MREPRTTRNSAIDSESLDTIGVLEGNVDKTSIHRDYLRHYERHFAEIREDPIQLLEIGVAGGTSLKTWARFFPRASIIGVDADESCRKITGDRITIEIGSQSDYGFLAGLVMKYTPDVIIDDGSHQAADMILTFDRLFPFLAPGGFYIIEDIYLHYGDFAAAWHSLGGCTAAEHFAAIARGVAANHVEQGSDAATKYYGESIDAIEFIPGAIIVRKARREDRSERSTRLWHLAERAGYAATWGGLSLILIHDKDLERAELAARRALELASTDSGYLVRLAWIQEHRGNLVDAVENMRLAVQFAPKGRDQERLLARYEELSGRAV